MESFELPEGIDYHAIQTVSYEAREKLATVRPRSLGQAGRIPGVSPSDLQNLLLEALRTRTRFT
jgi:tRNA uridine 5-carboxymethylaminomethyl modification enzyme